MSKFCPKCGTSLPDSAAFCTNCGTRFAPSASPNPMGYGPSSAGGYGPGTGSYAYRKPVSAVMILTYIYMAVSALAFICNCLPVYKGYSINRTIWYVYVDSIDGSGMFVFYILLCSAFYLGSFFWIIRAAFFKTSVTLPDVLVPGVVQICFLILCHMALLVSGASLSVWGWFSAILQIASIVMAAVLIFMLMPKKSRPVSPYPERPSYPGRY